MNKANQNFQCLCLSFHNQMSHKSGKFQIVQSFLANDVEKQILELLTVIKLLWIATEHKNWHVINKKTSLWSVRIDLQFLPKAKTSLKIPKKTFLGPINFAAPWVIMSKFFFLFDSFRTFYYPFVKISTYSMHKFHSFSPQKQAKIKYQVLWILARKKRIGILP